MWIYNNQPYTEIHDTRYHGFIYCMTYIPTGQKYIGKKSFWSFLNVKKGKKELALQTDKRLSKKKQVIKESDWKRYYSSNEFIKGVEDKSLVKREILFFCERKKDLTYHEERMLFVNDVINDKTYLNDNIRGVYFREKDDTDK